MSRQLTGKHIRFLRVCFINGVGHFCHQGRNLRSCCCRRFCSGVGLRFAGRRHLAVCCCRGIAVLRFSAGRCYAVLCPTIGRSGAILHLIIVRCSGAGSCTVILCFTCCRRLAICCCRSIAVLRHSVCCFPFPKALSGLLCSRCIFTDIRRAA